MSHKPMSMEAVMDQERREVLALLENRTASQPHPRSSSVASFRRSAASRSASPLTANPRSPMRNMLGYDDLEEPPPSATTYSGAASRGSPRAMAPVRSMLDVDGPPLTPVQPVRSMLDVGPSSPTMAPLKPVYSAQSSPTEANPRLQKPSYVGRSTRAHPRSMSDAASTPADFGPRSALGRSDVTTEYQFSDIITGREKPVLAPRRALQPSSSGAARHSSVAEIMRGADLGGLIMPGGQGLHGRSSVSSARGPKPKSRSPHNRLGIRSKSPHLALTNRPLSPAGRNFLEENEALDMSNAYRKLSDAILVQSGGSLANLPIRKQSDGTVSNNGRMAKVWLSPDGDELPDTSDDDKLSSDEDESNRGRKAARTFPPGPVVPAVSSPLAGSGGPSSDRPARSLLAAAEEERAQVVSSKEYKYRSLFDDPEITVTNPSGEKVKPTKTAVHPVNSFDVPSRSGSRTPWDSDDEADYTDIKRAQRLAFTMTPIMSNPGVPRSIRIINRGDFAKVHKEVTEEHGRPRKYLVATDLSAESTHALEWAIGTVLRDGDTLVAIYCVDEETGITLADGQDEPAKPSWNSIASAPGSTSRLTGMPSLSSLGVGTAANTAASSSATPVASRPSLLMKTCEQSSASLRTGSPAPVSQERSRAEEERQRAVQDITDRITKLLRKTSLQVRVVVEVLQCKNPRHLLTEVIDLLNPTMVVLGSRGRSALKGVILGSFSNYLVTKSSAPVMVARKKLKKGQYKRASAHQVNNLSNPTARSLTSAKID